MTCFGTSASYIAVVHEGGGRAARPAATSSRCARVGSTGSPLSPEGFEWVYEHVGADTWLFSTSGGTDVCTAFVGGVPTLPVYRGELQARALGADGAGVRRGRASRGRRGRGARAHRADAVDAALLLGRRGRRALCARPTSTCTRASGATATGSRSPSAARRSSTGARTRRSTAAASGWARARSTAPCWRCREVVDALVVDVPRAGEENWMPLFVVLRDGAELDDDLVGADPRARARGLLAAPRPERDPRDRRGPAHAVGQGARGAGQADPHGRAARAGGEPRLARQPGRARLLRRARRSLVVGPPATLHPNASRSPPGGVLDPCNPKGFLRVCVHAWRRRRPVFRVQRHERTH